MCDCQSTRGVTRREAIAGVLIVGSAIAATAGISAGARAAVGPAVPPVEVLPGLSIYPRAAWGANLPPTGPIDVESPQFLLVHHTASSNSYSSAVSLIQATYAFHTSAAKGWSDVCYEFFIGRDGDVWEGRAGALTGPVVADATGGNQGFAQLICLLGDFTSQPPTAAAQTSLVKVLAWPGWPVDTRSTSVPARPRRSPPGDRSDGAQEHRCPLRPSPATATCRSPPVPATRCTRCCLRFVLAPSPSEMRGSRP